MGHVREDPDAQYRELVHNPADLATEYVQWAERIQTTGGVPLGIPAVDRCMIPAHPGDVIAICGRPGMGKTSLMAYWARAEAKRIAAEDKYREECALYITFEQVAEELENIFQASRDYSASDVAWGRVDLDTIKANAVRRVRLPVWIVGNSMSRTNRKSPRMTPDVVFRAIETMHEDFDIRPRIMFFDYIQLIPIERATERVAQVSEAVVRIKELAQRVGCPAIIGVQAGRQVDERDFKVPQLADSQWASSIEQTVDKFFGLWRPWQTDQERGSVNVNGQAIPITPELLIMEMSKQRFEKSGFVWPLHFAPQYLDLCELELRATDREEVYL